LGVCYGRIGTLFGIRPRKTGCRGHHLGQIGAIVARHAGVTGRGQKDATGFRAFRRKIDTGSAASGPKKPIKFIAEKGLRSAGSRRR
jgi:hypothetical protein